MAVQYRSPAGATGQQPGSFLTGQQTEQIRLLLTGDANVEDIIAALRQIRQLGGELGQSAQSAINQLSGIPTPLRAGVGAARVLGEEFRKTENVIAQMQVSSRAVRDNVFEQARAAELNQEQTRALLRLRERDLASVREIGEQGRVNSEIARERLQINEQVIRSNERQLQQVRQLNAEERRGARFRVSDVGVDSQGNRRVQVRQRSGGFNPLLDTNVRLRRENALLRQQYPELAPTAPPGGVPGRQPGRQRPALGGPIHGRGGIGQGAGGFGRNLFAGTALSYSFQNFPDPELGRGVGAFGAFSQAATFGGIFVPGIGGIISTVIGGIGQGIISILNQRLEQERESQARTTERAGAAAEAGEAATAVEQFREEEAGNLREFYQELSDLAVEYNEREIKLKKEHDDNLLLIEEAFQSDFQGRVLGRTQSLGEQAFDAVRARADTEAITQGFVGEDTQDQLFDTALRVISPEQAENVIRILQELTLEHDNALAEIRQQISDAREAYDEEVNKIYDNWNDQMEKLRMRHAVTTRRFAREQQQAFARFLKDYLAADEQYEKTLENIGRQRVKFFEGIQDQITQVVQRFGVSDELRQFAEEQGLEVVEDDTTNDAERRRLGAFTETNMRIDEQHAATTARINFREGQRIDRFEREEARLIAIVEDTNNERRDSHNDLLARLAFQERQFTERFTLQTEQRAERFEESMDRIDLRHRRALNDIEFRELEANQRRERRIGDARERLIEAQVIPDELEGFVETQASNIALQRARRAQESLERVTREENRRYADLQANLDRRRMLVDEDRQLSEDSLQANFDRQEELADLQNRQFRERLDQQKQASSDEQATRKQQSRDRLADLRFVEGQAQEETTFQREQLDLRTEAQRAAAQRLLDAQTEEDIIASERELTSLALSIVRYEEYEAFKRLQAKLTRDAAILAIQEQYQQEITEIELAQEEYLIIYNARRQEILDAHDEALAVALIEHNDRITKLEDFETETTRVYENNTATIETETIEQAEAVIKLRNEERARLLELEALEIARFEDASDRLALEFSQKRAALFREEQNRRVQANKTLQALVEEESLKQAVYDETNRKRQEASGIDPGTGTVTVGEYQRTVARQYRDLIDQLTDRGLGATAEGQLTLQAIAAFGTLSQGEFSTIARELSTAYGGRDITIENIIDLLLQDTEFRDTFLNIVAAQGIQFGRPLDTAFISGLAAVTGAIGNIASLGLAPLALGESGLTLGTGTGRTGAIAATPPGDVPGGRGQAGLTSAQGDSISFISPVGGRVTSEFKEPRQQGLHVGTDFAATATREPDGSIVGTTIKAPESGVVTEIDYDDSGVRGIYLILRGDSGLEHLFAHLGSIPRNVNIDTRISSGQELGVPYPVDKTNAVTTRRVTANISHVDTLGDIEGVQDTTGTHLHYEVIIPDRPGGDDSILNRFLQIFNNDDVYISEGAVRKGYYRVNPRTVLGFQFGGSVFETGPAYLHEGEYVLNRENVGMMLQILNRLLELQERPQVVFDQAQFGSRFGDQAELDQTVEALNFTELNNG